MKKVLVYEIDWCVEIGCDVDSVEEQEEILDTLPGTIVLKIDEENGPIEDSIADALSDKYGWLVNGYLYQILEDPSKNTTTVYVIKPGEKTGEVVEIKSENPNIELEELQRLVEGYIEVAELDGYTVYVNEEGKLNGLLPNIVLDYDILCGNVVFTKCDPTNPDIMIDLTEADIEEIKSLYR